MSTENLSPQIARHVSGDRRKTSTPVAPAPTTDNLFSSYLRLFREFRRQDLVKFCDQHDQLYQEAKQTGDHTEVTRHYYGLMASVIATYYGEGWHFCPPQFKGQSRREATIGLYRQIADRLRLGQDVHALDVGCGVGGMMRFLARDYHAKMTGITLCANEVQQANQIARQENLDGCCQVIQGDSQQMPFEDESFDCVYAVYALKYYPRLDRVFSEIRRVLKPGGRLVAYCLCKSKTYRADDPEHAKLLSDFEYSTAMPSLHSVQSMMEAGEEHGLPCVAEEDISTDELNWYSYWVSNPMLPWLVSSPAVYGLTRFGESARVLPAGFARFNDYFLAGTLRHIIRGGRMGILTGSALLTFEKSSQVTG